MALFSSMDSWSPTDCEHCSSFCEACRIQSLYSDSRLSNTWWSATYFSHLEIKSCTQQKENEVGILYFMLMFKTDIKCQQQVQCAVKSGIHLPCETLPWAVEAYLLDPQQLVQIFFSCSSKSRFTVTCLYSRHIFLTNSETEKLH